MNNLEFRIYDKENNKWSSVRNLLLDRINVEKYYSFTESKNKRFIFQQYTCKKDKNNNKIYSGDILKIRFRTGKYKVIYDEEVAAFCLIPINWNEKEVYPIVNLLGERTGAFYEVTGNIFDKL